VVSTLRNGRLVDDLQNKGERVKEETYYMKSSRPYDLTSKDVAPVPAPVRLPLTEGTPPKVIPLGVVSSPAKTGRVKIIT
jgi:hypothetical protein